MCSRAIISLSALNKIYVRYFWHKVKLYDRPDFGGFVTPGQFSGTYKVASENLPLRTPLLFQSLPFGDKTLESWS
jgi:hypothetical protein